MFDPANVRSIMRHMNEDHADAVKLYARAFTEHKYALSARIISIDENGIVIECDMPNGCYTDDIPFPEKLKSEDEARGALMALADSAREKLAA